MNRSVHAQSSPTDCGSGQFTVAFAVIVRSDLKGQRPGPILLIDQRLSPTQDMMRINGLIREICQHWHSGNDIPD